MLNYEEFKDAIASQIKDHLPSEYADSEVKIHTVIKNNSTKLDGLIIRKSESSICPNIYLNQYFTDYEDGRGIEDILSDIARVRQMHDAPADLDVSAITDFSRIKDKIAAKLINTEQNKEYLEDKPHTDIADLSAVYYIDLGSDSSGTMSTVITSGLLSQYGITVEELHEIAVQNMGPKARFSSMFEVLSELMGANMPDEMQDSDNMMFVLTNDSKTNGAAMLLVPSTMDMIAKQLGSTSYFIIPSSIHETIFVKSNDNMNVKDLKNMIHEVNSTELSKADILSENLYVYDYDRHCIVAAA